MKLNILKTSDKHLIFGGKHFNRVYLTRKTILDLAEISLVKEQDMNSEIFNKASSR